MKPFLSVITVNYNNSQGLAKTIASVLAQQNASVEFLVIDGGSADESVQLIERHADNIAYWVSEKDEGIYAAMNKGIARASGRYLMFLNSGDALADSGVLYRCCRQLANDAGVDVLYGHVALSGRLRWSKDTSWHYPADVALPFFKTSTLNHQASLIKAALFTELGLYPTEHGLVADYGFFLACLLACKKFQLIDSVLVEYDVSGLSARDEFRQYGIERQLIWNKLVPAWARRLVDEHLGLSRTNNLQVVRWAIRLHKLLRG